MIKGRFLFIRRKEYYVLFKEKVESKGNIF